MKSSLYNLNHFTRSPLSFMHKMQEAHGDIVEFKLLHKHCLLVTDPGFAKKILKQEQIRKSRLVFDRITPITGVQGLVQLEGQAWEEQNALIRPHFTQSMIDSYISIIKANLAQLLVDIDNKNVTIHTTIMRFALDNILQVLGVPKHRQPPDLIDAFIKLNHLCGLRMRTLLSMPLRFPTQFDRKIILQKKRLARSLKHLLSQGNIRKNCFIDSLSGEVSADQLVQHIATLLFAGFETTASSISMSLAILSRQYEEQGRVFEECHDNPLCTLKDLRQLSYTRALYQETLRLYPPAYMLVREVTKAQKIDSVDLKKNHFIIINVHGIHRHKKYWQHAKQFKPERFLESDTLNKEAFLPFGNGRRICTGNHLALTESLLTIGELVRHYVLTSKQSVKPLTNTLVTLHPRNDIWIQFNKR